MTTASATAPPRLIPVYSPTTILPRYRGTPIERLLLYHNLKHPAPAYERAELLLAACMDNRKSFHLPDRFAFVIRTAAGNLRDNEFRTAFAIGVGGVRAIAIVGHTGCGMVGLRANRRAFIEGLVANAGWTAEDAEAFFDENAGRFEIDNEASFVARESARIRDMYPRVLVAPLIYKVETGLLYQVEEPDA